MNTCPRCGIPFADVSAWLGHDLAGPECAYAAGLKAIVDTQGDIICWYEDECDEDHNLDKPDDLQAMYDELDAAEAAKESQP